MTLQQTPVIFPISQQDITPYHNGLYHFNSIMQPHMAKRFGAGKCQFFNVVESIPT